MGKVRGEPPIIELTRFDDSKFHVNADLIEVVEGTPNTYITLINGHHYLVSESTDEMVSRVIEYQRATGAQSIRRSRSNPAQKAQPGADTISLDPYTRAAEPFAPATSEETEEEEKAVELPGETGADETLFNPDALPESIPPVNEEELPDVAAAA